MNPPRSVICLHATVLIYFATIIHVSHQECNILGLFGSSQSGTGNILGGLSDCLTTAVTQPKRPPPIDSSIFSKLITGLGQKISKQHSQCYVRGDATHNATLLQRMFRGLTEGNVRGESCLTSNRYQSPVCLGNKNPIHTQLTEYLRDCEDNTLRLKIYPSTWKPELTGCVFKIPGTSNLWSGRWQLDLAYDETDFTPVNGFECGVENVSPNRAAIHVQRDTCLWVRDLLQSSQCDVSYLHILADPNRRDGIQACAQRNLYYSNTQPRRALERCMCDNVADLKPSPLLCSDNVENSPACLSFDTIDTEAKFQTQYLAGCLGTQATRYARSTGFSCLTQENDENQPQTADAYREALRVCDQEILKLHLNVDDQCVYYVPGESEANWRKGSRIELRLNTDQMQRSARAPGFKCSSQGVEGDTSDNRDGELNKKHLTIFRTACQMLVGMLEPRSDSKTCQSLCRLEVFRQFTPDLIASGSGSGSGSSKTSGVSSDAAKRVLECVLTRMPNWYTDPAPLMDPSVSSSCFARELPPQC